ncbi:trimeric intracellular cation channel family protein [Lysobacter sp. 5GHs7-4]|uniref:trimeric intracellular cation channel family protein n=1 Tax=Lysobacter sp. 5GHs7-4 TaxID=2904253 RepID=UPI001E5B576B|nr:trimeric intracellular cation channel family protein [Lysobacter sp. 5GHs7-4]UHQ23893.1 trimeric intracellular cation channel family protein [Lysobacter sp. 5GHs7-4]
MLLHIAYLIAIAAEAMTAALVAGRRNMDWLGVCVIACITALGGGTLRDVLLGHHPLGWVEHPIYLGVTIGAALLTAVVAPIMRKLRTAFLVLDALGLVVFTIIGCNVGITMELPVFIVLISGMITGTFGGVLRDMLCGQIPLLFQKELYATVSLLTGLIYVAAQRLGLSHDGAMCIAMTIGFTVRMLAIRYHWEMPKFVYKEDWD